MLFIGISYHQVEFVVIIFPMALYWAAYSMKVQAIGKHHYPTQNLHIASHFKQILTPTYYILSQTKSYGKYVLGYAYRSLGYDYRDLRYDYRGLRYDYRGLRYDYRGLRYDYRGLGYDYRRLRYHYLSLWYLYQRA